MTVKPIIMKLHHLSFFLLLTFLLSCSGKEESNPALPAPDYASSVYWYDLPDNPAPKAVDIFYVYPTLGTHPVDDEGNALLYTNINKQRERDAAHGNQAFNKTVYAADDFNFYAPYYRQMVLDVYFMDSAVVVEKAKLPETDITEAFEYYWKHFNNGRPFILLAHSQGSQLLIELLKDHMTNEQRNQMVAAYLFGYQITKGDLEQYKHQLIPAQSEDDLGCIILYNSLTNIGAKSPLMAYSAVGINPLNWKTDTTFAPASLHKGLLKYNAETQQFDTIPHYTSTVLDQHYLICADVNPDECYQESLKELFPYGNLHFMDSYLYALNIKGNMDLRAQLFLKKEKEKLASLQN